MRLDTLTPADVGRAATAAVLQRLSRLALPLSPGVTLRWDSQGDTGLGLTVADLCAWAQRGEMGDWVDHEDAADDGTCMRFDERGHEIEAD